jgi:uncharacterized membrane protein
VSATPQRGLSTVAATAARLETIAARLLTWGTRAALLLVLLGVVDMALSGVYPLGAASFPPYSLTAIPGQIAALRPEGFIWAGLTVLVALPLGRVTVSGAGFLAAHDRRLALVSVLVLLVICASVVAALSLEG